ncbi:MAG: carboxypeptidase-like regulatory domain-containing protein [Chitinophagaceae bacterium]
MSKKIALSIAEPCHENWENMNPDANARPDDPVGRGKFCGSCQKQVIDFSNMSDREVAQFFKKPSTGSVCGRFMTDQLNREIEIPKKRIPWAKHFFTFLLPAFLISKASAQNIKMGKIMPVEKDTIRTPMTSEYRTLGMVAPKNIEPFKADTIKVCVPELITNALKGKIVDEAGNAVPYASIQVGKSLNTYVADEKGEFVIHTELLGKNKSLLISSVGFESKEVTIDGVNNFLKIEMKSTMLGEVVVTATSGLVKGEIIAGGVTVRRINEVDEIVSRDIEVPISQNKFFIYPNPVLSGGNISLGVTMMEEGYYAVNFLSLSGQLMQQKEIWIDGEVRVLNIDVPKTAAGSYFLVFTNKKTGKKMTEKIIIQ